MTYVVQPLLNLNRFTITSAWGDRVINLEAELHGEGVLFKGTSEVPKIDLTLYLEPTGVPISQGFTHKGHYTLKYPDDAIEYISEKIFGKPETIDNTSLRLYPKNFEQPNPGWFLSRV